MMAEGMVRDANIVHRTIRKQPGMERGSRRKRGHMTRAELWDEANHCAMPGSTGIAQHCGTPLTVAEIASLEDGAEVVVTWNGGNGPHPYRVTVDDDGERYAGERVNCNPLLTFGAAQRYPISRVTRAAAVDGA
jgi:hypothetical protein